MGDLNLKDTKFSVTLDAKLENQEIVIQFIDNLLENSGCIIKAKLQIDVAIDELFSNVAYYAYAPDTGKVTVDYEFDGAMATIRFTDSGVPYNPMEKPDPDVTLPAEERGIGGLGIFLVKKSMDEMFYEFKDGQNILTIRKRILP